MFIPSSWLIPPINFPFDKHVCFQCLFLFYKKVYIFHLKKLGST